MQQIIQNTASFKESNVKKGCSLMDRATDNNEEMVQRIDTRVPKDKKQWRTNRIAHITIFRRECNIKGNI